MCANFYCPCDLLDSISYVGDSSISTPVRSQPSVSAYSSSTDTSPQSAFHSSNASTVQYTPDDYTACNVAQSAASFVLDGSDEVGDIASEDDSAWRIDGEMAEICGLDNEDEDDEWLLKEAMKAATNQL